MNNNQTINNSNQVPIVNNNSQTQIINNASTNKKQVTTKKPKKIRFKYKVRTKEGKPITGNMDATNKLVVQNFLLGQGYEILQINEVKGQVFSSGGFTRKMSYKDLNFFLTQLSTYIKAGIPLVDSMEILSRQAKKKKRKELYIRIVSDLNMGITFSDSLYKQGNVFPKMLINMLKTSELTGNLTEILDEMAAYYKRADSNNKQIKNAMTYPSILLVFAIAILAFVILWVVPSFTSMYATTGSELPKLTRMVIDVSDFIGTYYLHILGILFVIGLLFAMLYKNSKSFRYGIQWIILHIPVVSDIVKYNELVMFTSTFATLIKHDVFITDSMDILGRISNNEIYKEIINKAIVNLSNGESLSKAFEGQWAFPNTAYEMLVTGERTGRLGPMMENVANYYQEEQSNIVTRLKSLIEPIMIIVLSFLVGIILLSVVYPMFDIYKTMI